ncbi:MAG: hypothetical protein JWL90_53 [Chthoniobacteraceae bacterium]|nr:hypothetical protein [Chthoniobacteraceae bacterium]
MKKSPVRSFLKRGSESVIGLAWMLLIACAASAALTTTPGPPSDGSPTPPEIRDIAPPIDVFPYPPWMVAGAAALALLIVVLAIVLLVRWMRNQPPPPSLSPREVALKELRALENQVAEMEPYAFSIAVSEVLRRFIGRHYGLQALRQTSPEFLAAVAMSRRFSEEDRALLSGFLEKCDMIKFARIGATRAESETLLGSAMAFVEGARG